MRLRERTTPSLKGTRRRSPMKQHMHVLSSVKDKFRLHLLYNERKHAHTYEALTTHRLHDPTLFNTHMCSAATAHEKAFNMLRVPQERLARLNSLPMEDKQKQAVARKIDQTEVECGKRQAQLDATSRMLKDRARHFLQEFTPMVEAAMQAFAVRQHEAYHQMALLIGRHVAGSQGGDIEGLRERCKWFLQEPPGPESPPHQKMLAGATQQPALPAPVDDTSKDVTADNVPEKLQEEAAAVAKAISAA